LKGDPDAYFECVSSTFYLLSIALFLEGYHVAMETGHLAVSYAFKVWLDLSGCGLGIHGSRLGASLPIPAELKAALDTVPLPRGGGDDCRSFFWNGISSERAMKGER
jgi:hypothetical protein